MLDTNNKILKIIYIVVSNLFFFINHAFQLFVQSLISQIITTLISAVKFYRNKHTMYRSTQLCRIDARKATFI